MQAQGFDALLAFSHQWIQGHVRYLSNFRPLTFNADGTMWTPALVLVPLDGEPTLFVPDNETYLAEEVSYLKNIKPIKKSFTSELKAFNDKRLPKKIGIEGLNIMPVTVYQTVQQSFPGVELVSSGILTELRMVKSRWEIEMLEKSAQITDDAVLAGIHAIKEGVMERQVSAEMHKALLNAGARLAFGPLVGTGARSAREVNKAGNAKIRRGDYITLDTGAVWEGYHGDLTRGAALGPIPKEYRDIIGTVIQGYENTFKAARVGAKVEDINKASWGVIEQAGYGKYFPHEVIHGVGLDIEEQPTFAHHVIKENMPFVIECAIYYPGKLGLRLEELVIPTEAGSRKLSKLDYTYDLP